MKTNKRIIAVFLMLVMLLSVCSPAVAESKRTYRKYENYVCLGDSIAAGCSLSKDGNETCFDPTVEDPIATYNSDVLYLGLDFASVPNAYHSAVASTLRAKLYQCSRSALRTVELRYFLDGVYNDVDSKYLWGKQFLGDDLNIQVNNDLDVPTFLRDMGKKAKILESVKKADLITINIGSNDLFSYPVVCALDQLSTKVPELSLISSLFKKTGNIGTAFSALLDVSNNALTVPLVLSAITEASNNALTNYKENYTAILDAIYAVNPDVTVVSVGLFNPLKNTVLKEDSKINVRLLTTGTVSKANTFLSGLSSQYRNYHYVAIPDTDVYAINMNDANAVDLFLLKAHPTISGHAYIAEQILNALPQGLAAPTLKVKNLSSNGRIKLSWNAVDGASRYKIYRSNYKNGTYKLIGKTNELSYTDKESQPGVKHYYKVTADKLSYEGMFSNIVSARCGCVAPTLSSSCVASSGKIKLTWNSVADAERYEIWRATGKNGTFKKIYIASGTSFTNTGAQVGKTYYYKVRAINDKGAVGAFSNVVYRTCDCARPVVKASNDPDTGKVKLSWSAVSGAVKYEVYRATSKNGTYYKQGTTTKTSYTNSSAVAAKKYYYKVKAIASFSAANSAYSTVVTRTCDLERPQVKGKIVNGKPYISWDKVDKADEYEIYRSVNSTKDFEIYYITDSTSFKNTSVYHGVYYYYKVVAINYKSPAASSAYSRITEIRP